MTTSAYMEQPCEGLENMARVAQNTDVPIMADESAWSARDVLRLIEWKAAEMVSVYYTKPGGLMKAKKLLAVAETGGLLCDINGSGEMGVGNAANLHLAASSRDHLPARHDPGHLHRRDRPHQGRRATNISTTSSRCRSSTATAACWCRTVPGLGIEVDEAKLRKYAYS